jgi:hypothetical protein
MPDDGQTEIDHKAEFLMNLNAAKIDRIESALEKNWIAHLILAGVGLAVVLDIANLPALIANYFTKGEPDKKAVAVVVLAILLYYFMKLGYLLTSFVDASQLQESLLKDYLREPFEESKMMPLRKSTNFFVEAFSSAESIKAGKWFSPYLLVTSIVVSVAQAAALFSIVQAYHLDRWFPSILLLSGAGVVVLFIKLHKWRKAHLQKPLLIGSGGMAVVGGMIAFAIWGWSPVILLLCGVVLVTLYILFWNSQKDHPQTTIVVVPSALLAVLWLFVFALARR